MAARKKSPAPDDLTTDQKRALWKWKETKYPWMAAWQVREAVEDALEYHRAAGSTWADWRLVCQRWIRKNVEDGKIHPPSRQTEQEREIQAQERAERAAYDRAAKREMEKIGPLDLAGLIAESKAVVPR